MIFSENRFRLSWIMLELFDPRLSVNCGNLAVAAKLICCASRRDLPLPVAEPIVQLFDEPHGRVRDRGSGRKNRGNPGVLQCGYILRRDHAANGQS